jgi:hypothetical protein
MPLAARLGQCSCDRVRPQCELLLRGCSAVRSGSGVADIREVVNLEVAGDVDVHARALPACRVSHRSGHVDGRPPGLGGSTEPTVVAEGTVRYT